MFYIKSRSGVFLDIDNTIPITLLNLLTEKFHHNLKMMEYLLLALSPIVILYFQIYVLKTLHINRLIEFVSFG